MFGAKGVDKEADLEETNVKSEDPKTEDEYEAMFQPQYSTPKGPIIQSPTRQQGGSSHQKYLDKPKAPMDPQSDLE